MSEMEEGEEGSEEEEEEDMVQAGCKDIEFVNF